MYKRRLHFSIGLLFLCLLVPSQAVAQLSKLDEAGKRLAARFKSLKPHPAIVNVADFSSSGNALLLQAHYLAWYLSSSLEFRGKDSLRIPDHNTFDRDLTKIRNSTDAALSFEDVARIHSQIGGDFIVTGSIDRKDWLFLINLRAQRVSDGTLVDSLVVEVRSSEFLESLSIPTSTPLRLQNGQTPYHPGANGISMPSCHYMPDPSYTDVARGNKVNGVVVLEAIISAQGTIQQIHPVKLLGQGLDEQAYNTVKMWKCNPARTKDGTPVAVVVPIEISFRLY